MAFGALTLADYPADLIRLACRRCQRRGQYRKDRLIAEHGAGKPLPDLRADLAQCTGGITSGQWSACGAYFVDLSIGEE